MNYLEKKEKESYLLYLIEHKRLRCIEKVSKDFNCSKKTVKRIIYSLRTQGYDIIYCRGTKRYLLNEKS